MSPKSAIADLGGFPQKMRPRKESRARFRFNLIGTRSSRALPLRALPKSDALYRVHQTHLSAKHFGRSGDWRFDAPDASYGTLYAGLAPEVSFAEALLRGDGHVAQSEIALRSLCRFLVLRPLRLMRTFGPHMIRIGQMPA